MMSLNYAAAVKRGSINQKSSLESAIAATPTAAAIPSTLSTHDHHTGHSLSINGADKAAQTVVVGRKMFSEESHTLKYSRSKALNARPIDEASFNKVCRRILNEIANIGPYAEAERRGTPQYGDRAAKLVALAVAQDDKRMIRQSKRENQEALKRFQLMKLPFEIRHSILDFAIHPIDIPIFHGGYRFKHPIPLPPVARTRNQRLNLEGLIVTIEKTSFRIKNKHALEGFKDWLSGLDLRKLDGDTSYETGFDAVKTLSFQSFDFRDFPDEGIFSIQKSCPLLMIQCKNLRGAVISIRPRDIAICGCVDDSDDRPASLDHIRRSFALDGILSLFRLEILQFELDSSESACHRDLYDEAVYSSLDKLKKWLDVEFDKRNQRVRIIVPTELTNDPLD